MEIVEKTLTGIHSSGVKYIRENGELVKDQNGDSCLFCHNVHFVCDSQDMNHVPMGSTTERLDNDFAAGLIYPSHAMLRGLGFDYGYGWRMWELNLIEKAVKLLKQHPDTRRAYIPLFRPEDVGSLKEIPCCVGYQIEIIDGLVCMTTIFRSNDCGQASPSDDYGFRQLQRYFAFRLGRGIGKYCRYVINAHLKMGDSDKFDMWGRV
jgi:thymidylate synthase